MSITDDINDDLFGVNLKNDNIENSIRNILNTKKGTVPGLPHFGTELDKFLFELMNPLQINLLREEIINSLKRWEPRIKIVDFQFDEDYDYNRREISLKYNILDDINNTDFSFKYII